MIRSVSTPSRMIRGKTSPSVRSSIHSSPTPEVDPFLEEVIVKSAQKEKRLMQENKTLREEVLRGSYTEISGIPIQPPDFFGSKFSFVRMIGQGGFGSVCECIHRLDKGTLCSERSRRWSRIQRTRQSLPRTRTCNAGGEKFGTTESCVCNWLQGMLDSARKFWVSFSLYSNGIMRHVIGGCDL